MTQDRTDQDFILGANILESMQHSEVRLVIPSSQNLPNRLRTLPDANLRTRACEAWRLLQELLGVLHAWKHFVFFASQIVVIEEAAQQQLIRRHPALGDYRSALQAVREQRLGNDSVDTSETSIAMTALILAN